MFLTNDDVNKLAKLSRLKFDDEERKLLVEDLNNIFKMIKIMQEVDTKNVEPISHPHVVFQRLRDDLSVKVQSPDEYQKIAPLVKDRFYLVPKVIE